MPAPISEQQQAAQGLPQQFSSSDGSLQGVIDGTNLVFKTGVNLRRAAVFRNGVLMTINVDYVAGGQFVVFLNVQTPQPGDILTVSGFPAI